MIRSLFGLLVVIGVLLLPGTVLADPGPPRPEPTPHAQRTALTGRVPVPSGTTVTLKTIDLDDGLIKDCETSTSRSGPDGSPETSSFQFVLDGDCLAGAEGVFVCWSPQPRDCNVVTASLSMLRLSDFKLPAPSFTELGQTLRTGLLATLPSEIDPEFVSPVDLAGHAADGTLPLDELADSGQQTTTPSGFASDPGPDQQATDLSQTEQSPRYGWLLWAGAALLVAGLGLGAALRVRARRR